MAHELSPKDLAIAHRLGEWHTALSPHLASARWDASERCLVLAFTASSATLRVPLANLPELAEASDEALAEVGLWGPLALRWEGLDVDLDVRGLVFDLLMPPDWREASRLSQAALQREAARLAGRKRSPAKAEAARRNGQKGGRPKTPAPRA